MDNKKFKNTIKIYNVTNDKIIIVSKLLTANDFITKKEMV